MTKTISRISTALVTVVALAATGCSVRELGLTDTASLRSDTVVGSVSAPTVTGPTDAGDPGTAGQRADRSTVAVGGTDGDPALSTDPDQVYRADTCLEPPQSGAQPEVVDCERPHTIEIYAVRELPGADGTAVPGFDTAVELCNQDFQRITGVGVGLATIYRRSLLRPSEETWSAGERDVTCYVVYPRQTVQRLAEIDPLRGFGLVSIFGMDAGDCFIDFDDSRSTLQPVDCDEPHDAEVFVDHEFPGGEFPGDAVIDRTADDLCFGRRFEDFVGVDYRTSAILSLRSRPTAETWEYGDRTINCVLTDELVRAGSFRDSGL